MASGLSPLDHHHHHHHHQQQQQQHAFTRLFFSAGDKPEKAHKTTNIVNIKTKQAKRRTILPFLFYFYLLLAVAVSPFYVVCMSNVLVSIHSARDFWFCISHAKNQNSLPPSLHPSLRSSIPSF